MSSDALRTLCVLAGGAAGALTRAAIGHAWPYDAGAWPWATFTANIAGTLLLAYVMTRFTADDAHSAYRRLLLGTGFCGALTTFSTLQVETIDLMRADELGLAAAYAATSLGAGTAAVVLVTSGVRRRHDG
jgi:fluoride exporter